MIILALFLTSCFLLGYVLTSRMRFFDNLIERACAATMLGLSIGTLLAFCISYLMGSLSAFSIMSSAIILFAISYLLIRLFGLKFARPHFKFGKFGLPEGAILLILLILFYFNNLSLTQDAEGNIYGISNSWADYAFHIGIINSFALRDNYPPIYPNLAGAQMRYPFLVDFLSSIFVKEGVGIIPSITIPNYLLLVCLVILTFAFLRAFLGNRNAAAIAVLLFFLNGHLGFVSVIGEFADSGDKAKFLSELPQDYGKKAFQFLNLIFAVFIPQRGALMGFPLVMLLMILLWRVYNSEADRWEYPMAGFLISLLPLVHASSFAISAIIAFFVFLTTLWKKRRIEPGWWLALGIFLVIAFPQLLFINQQQRVENFFGPQWGWTSKATQLADLAGFWLFNAGLTLPLGIIGLFLIGKKRLVFMIPFMALFLAANVVRFQPWDWDNMKVLMYWFFMLCAAAGVAVIRIGDVASRLNALFGKALAILLILICTFSAGLTFLAWNSSGAELWSATDVATAKFIERNTPEDAVFLTAGKHNHLAYTLAGRQILAGYEGHLWSHGLIYTSQRDAAREIYATGSLNLMRKWGIDYVFIGPAETFEWGANLELFENSPDFEKVMISDNGWMNLFKVREK